MTTVEKMSKKYDNATTPHRRAQAHGTVAGQDMAILADTYTGINAAAVQRQIQRTDHRAADDHHQQGRTEVAG